MSCNLEKFKLELRSLVDEGSALLTAIKFECFPEKIEKQVKTALGVEAKEYLELMPSFEKSYQSWYSKSKAVIRQVLPDRLNDFVGLYEKPKNRKQLDNGNYVIHDYLQGLSITRYGGEMVVSPSAAIPQFSHQLNILKSAEQRFDSALFDIKHIAMADLFDSEIDTAKELLENKFLRAAGAIAGVVLEKHLLQVCDDHAITVTKKNPHISDLNELLRTAGVTDVPQWRNIQMLADIRNICDHNKKVEPTIVQVGDLVDGVAKLLKTLA